MLSFTEYSFCTGHYVMILSHKSICVGFSVAQSCLTLLCPYGLQPPRLLCPWDSPGRNTGVGGHSLLQGIFLTHGLNPSLLRCRYILYIWATGELYICPQNASALFVGTQKQRIHTDTLEWKMCKERELTPQHSTFCMKTKAGVRGREMLAAQIPWHWWKYSSRDRKNSSVPCLGMNLNLCAQGGKK